VRKVPSLGIVIEGMLAVHGRLSIKRRERPFERLRAGVSVARGFLRFRDACLSGKENVTLRETRPKCASPRAKAASGDCRSGWGDESGVVCFWLVRLVAVVLPHGWKKIGDWVRRRLHGPLDCVLFAKGGSLKILLTSMRWCDGCGATSLVLGEPPLIFLRRKGKEVKEPFFSERLVVGGGGGGGKQDK